MFKKKFQIKKVAETFTVGDCLRRKREEAGISLKETSVRLGIRYDYLESLESGNYLNLPPQVYVRGFIKSYAGFLGVDGGQLIKIYNREVSLSGDVQSVSQKKEKKNRKLDIKKYLVVTPRILTVAASLAVISVLGYYFIHQINSFNSKPYLFIESPAADSFVTAEREVWLNGKTEDDAILRVNGQIVSVGSDGIFSQKIALGEGRNSLVIEAVNRFNKAEKKEINIIYEKPKEDKSIVEVQEENQEGVKGAKIEVEEVIEYPKSVAPAVSYEEQNAGEKSDDGAIASAESAEAAAKNDKTN